MNDSPGLPARMEYSAIPNYYLNMVMPLVDNLEELKLSLHIFRIINSKKGTLQYASRSELLADPAITEGFKNCKQPLGDRLDEAVSRITDRGVIISLKPGVEPDNDEIILLNTPANRGAVESGKLNIATKKADYHPAAPAERMSDIFTYYEENIGLLTSLIADELRLAEQSYPQAWIIEAIREAVLNNKRSWRYISRILERWLTEGKANGTHRQDNSADDPSKYTTGKYQRFVQH